MKDWNVKCLDINRHRCCNAPNANSQAQLLCSSLCQSEVTVTVPICCTIKLCNHTEFRLDNMPDHNILYESCVNKRHQCFWSVGFGFGLWGTEQPSIGFIPPWIPRSNRSFLSHRSTASTTCYCRYCNDESWRYTKASPFSNLQCRCRE